MAVTDEAISKIKDMLIRGELKAGDRLPPEKELSERLGLSRSSLREAVKALELIRGPVPRIPGRTVLGPPPEPMALRASGATGCGLTTQIRYLSLARQPAGNGTDGRSRPPPPCGHHRRTVAFGSPRG
jgi:DNA-binding transcriptional MocR family regulator